MKVKTLALLIGVSLPIASYAQSHSDLKKEIEALKAQVNELRGLIGKQRPEPALAPAAASSNAGDKVDPVEFNKVRVKVEALEDNMETSGLKGLKISGFIDPVYMYNSRAGRGSFQFLNNNYNADPTGTINDLTQDNFSYANSYFGGVTLKFEKELEGGVKTMLSLRPRRTVANTYDFGNIVEEAGVWVPFNGLAWKAWAGQAISWNGYEYVQSNLKKNITSNLLIDYAGPGFVTGAGVEYQQGKWWIKTALGNLNTSSQKVGDNRSSGAHWRVDYSRGEFQGWGASGMHGHQYNKTYNYLEADAYFVRGDWTLQGQIEGSTWKKSGFGTDDNGNQMDTGHFGVSALAAYKFTPQLEGIVRADWFDNRKGGGGTPATNMGTANCPRELMDDGAGTVTADNVAASCGDYRGGFGPGAVQTTLTDGSTAWVLGDTTRGAKRKALTLGLNYQYHTNALLKFELRQDFSDLYSFYDYKTGNYKKSNTTLGVQTVISF